MHENIPSNELLGSGDQHEYESLKTQKIDLIALNNELISRVDEVTERLFQEGKELKEVEAVVQREIERFLKECVKNKSNFSSIFKTETGSVYFIAENGHTLRVKMDDGEYKIQPVTKKIIFMSPEEIEKFLEVANRDYENFFLKGIFEYRFSKAPISIGSTPLEFGLHGFSELAFNETADELTVLGRLDEGKVTQEGGFSSGVHVGHPISEIIK
jgi:hypothetical protein